MKYAREAGFIESEAIQKNLISQTRCRIYKYKQLKNAEYVRETQWSGALASFACQSDTF